jgi:hypothetical protein
VSLIINGNSFSSAGSYQVAVIGTSGSTTHSLNVPFNVGDYLINGPMTLSSAPAGQATANLTFSSTNFYAGQVNATCDASALAGAICTLSPPNPIAISASSSVPVTATISVPNNAAPGTYNININSNDVTGEPTAAWTIALTVLQDFTVGALTPSTTQTINAGESETYNFYVLPVGSSFTNAVSLACSGAPTISLCTFTPNPATPGNNVTGVQVALKISTTASSASLSPQGPNLPSRPIFTYALWLALPMVALLSISRRRKKYVTLPASLLGLFLLALLLASCGGGSNGGSSGTQQQGTKPGTYTITVTGTSGSLSHTAPTITLVVN